MIYIFIPGLMICKSQTLNLSGRIDPICKIAPLNPKTGAFSLMVKMSMSQIKVSVHGSSFLLMQTWGGSVDGPSDGVLATHMGDLSSCSLFQLPAHGIYRCWRGNRD